MGGRSGISGGSPRSRPLHDETGRCAMPVARFVGLVRNPSQMMFASLNKVRKDLAGSISRWAQKVLYSVPSKRDLVK